mgnify:CR=1 FL=1
MPSLLEQLSADLVGAVDRAARSTVAIHARRRIPASGVLWRPGIVVATHHTVHKDIDVPVTLAGGAQRRATVIGRDPGTDLVALRLEDGGPPGEATPAELARDPLRVGQLVLAVGRPGEGVTAAHGAVSAVGPAWRTWQGGHVDQFVRLDVAVYDGFSGGPLVDAAGRVAGIDTSALARAAALAIPVPTVERVVDRLLAGGSARRGYLGLGSQPVRLPEPVRAALAAEGRTQQVGLMIVALEPGAPAERGGLLLGDVLLALDGTATEDPQAVLALLGPDTPGQVMRADLLRAGERRTLPITVGEHPGS